MTLYRSLVLVVVVALAVAWVAGCGGDGETTEAPAPNRQEFAAQADAICRSAEQDLGAAQEDLEDEFAALGSRADQRAEAAFVEEEVIPIFQRQVDEIRELTPPPGEGEEIEAALSAAERDIADLHADQSRVPKGLRGFNHLFQRYGGDTSRGCG